MFLFRQWVLTSWRRDLSERKILRSLRNNAIQGRCRVIRRSEPVHWVYHGVGVCKLCEWISGCWDRGRGLQDTAILAGQANLVSGCLLGSTGSIRLPFSTTKKNKLSAVPYSQLFSTSIRLTTRNRFPIIFLQTLDLPTPDERDSNNILHPLAQAIESHDGLATYGDKEIWHFLLVLLPCVSVLPATFRNVSVRTMNDHHHEKDKVEPRERTPGRFVSIAGLWIFFRGASLEQSARRDAPTYLNPVIRPQDIEKNMSGT